MMAVIFLIIFTLIASAIGNEVFRRFLPNERLPLLSEMAFSLGIGITVVIFATMLLGFLGLLYSWSAYALFIVLGILSLFLKRNKITLSHLGRWRECLTFQNASGIFYVLLAIFSFFALLNFIGSLAPPTFADTVRYHLAIPKSWIWAHKIEFVSYLHFNLPRNIETLYAYCMLLHNDIFASLVNFTLGIFVAIVIYELGKQFMPGKYALLSALMFYSVPCVTWESTITKNDLGMLFFGMLSLYAFYLWTKTENKRWIFLAAAFIGMCAGTKPLGLFSLVAFTGMMVFWMFLYSRKNRGFSIQKSLSLLLQFEVLALIFASPWYLVNLYHTGNPFWPLFYDIFGGKYWNLNKYLQLVQYNETHYKYLGTGFFSYLAGFWNVFFKGDFEHRGPGILILSFVPAFLFIKRRESFLNYLFLYVLIYYTLWFRIDQHGMFLIPVFTVLFLIAGYVVFKLSDIGKIFRLSCYTVVIVALSFSLGMAMIYNSQFIPVVFGMESKQNFLSQRVWYYKGITYINERLPKDAKILFDSNMHYYLDKPYIGEDFIDYEQLETVDDLVNRLRELGVTHVFTPEPQTRFAEQPEDKPEEIHYKRLRRELRGKYLTEVYHGKDTINLSRTLSQTEEVEVYIYKLKA